MITKRMFTVIAVICVTGTAGCGTRQDGATKDSAAGVSQAESWASSPAELVFYTTARTAPESFDQQIGNALRKKFPNYTIKYIQRNPGTTDIPNLIADGTRIDIDYESAGSFAAAVLGNGLNFDMTELIKAHKVDLGRFEPATIDSMRQMSDGKLYGLPTNNSTYALYYNKDLFDKFGVPYPKDGMTWDDIYALSQKLNRNEGGKLTVGFVPSVNHMVLLNPLSVPLIDKKTNRSTYGDSRWKQIVETQLLRFADNDTYRAAVTQNKNKYLDMPQFTTDQMAAMYINSNGLAASVSQAEVLSKFNWDIVAMPSYKELPNVGYQPYPTYFAITSMAKDKDAAMEAIKYLTSDEFQAQQNKTGNMTVLKDANIQKTLGQETRFKDKNWHAFFYDKYPAIPEKTVYEDLLKKRPYTSLVDRLPGLMLKTQDINTALREAEEEVNKNITEYQQK